MHLAGPLSRCPSALATILAAKDIYSSRSARACATCGSRMAQRRSRARRRCDVLSWSWLVLFRPLGVLHVQLWSGMVAPARHMFVIYVVQLIQRKISCLESWHGLTISTTKFDLRITVELATHYLGSSGLHRTLTDPYTVGKRSVDSLQQCSRLPHMHTPMREKRSRRTRLFQHRQQPRQRREGGKGADAASPEPPKMRP